MASTRNEPLLENEEDEEKMKNELLKAGFNEPMDKSEMIRIYQILQESKETSLLNQEISSLSSIDDIKSTQNTSNIAEYTPFGFVSNTSNNIATTSSNFITRPSSSKHQFNIKEKSTEFVLNKSFDTNLINDNIIFDIENSSQDVFSNNDFPPIKENISVTESNDEETPEVIKSRLERWRINPFDFVETKGAPLNMPEHLRSRLEPISLPTDFADSEIYERLCQKMSVMVDNLHERFVSYDESESDLKWGSPIKVPPDWDDSVDRNPVVENSPDSDASTKDVLDRVSKRKALSNIEAATHDIIDESSADELVNTKKRKFQQGKRVEEEEKKNEESQKSKASFVSPVEIIEVDDFSKDLSNSELSDITYLRNLRKSSIKKSRINTESDCEQLQYPRRVPPPNPAKKNFKGPKTKKKYIIESKSSSSLQKDLYINDEEINKTLHELNEEIDDNDCVDIDITDEKKNSPTRTYLQNKLQKACSYLETINVVVEQRIKAVEETKKQKEIEETMKRDERICKRLQEQEEENLRRIERERIRSEKEKSYIAKLKTKKITRANFDNPQSTHEDITEDLLLSGTDDELTTTYSNLRNSCCPICQKSFPFDEIESHASECDAFLSEPDEMVDQQPCSSRLLYECDICNKFNTYDGNYYEEHVVECMKADKDKHGIYV